ncbi:MAG TPA: hypothetical protein RMH99_01885 [Sandaracinaceae bacterium LLY-WYZ-13_1]|nr:hypothetical protein [Sandaracinaceae bacterium LLY-WYZ-13_1]
MPKKASTIENRVYIFDTLAEALLNGAAGDLLVSTKDGDRARAMRALADAAYVSCVVADTGELEAEGVRGAVLAEAEGGVTVPPVPRGKAQKKRRGGKGGKAGKPKKG